jgi:hypothetical protein
MNFHRIPKSKVIRGFKWLNERTPYPKQDIKGDTYPMTWAADGHIYASAGDPLWGESPSGLDVERFSGGPEDYEITKFSHMNDYLGWGANGPKPSGMISVDGVLYLAFQNYLLGGYAPHSNKSQPGSDAHIIRCAHNNQLWYPSYAAIKDPMFPGYKFGGPAFINFGQENANARDEYVYAVSSDQWDNGSNLRLGRVQKGCITQRSRWEFLCAYERDGSPVWHTDLDASHPILSIHRYISLPEMTYLAAIKRYLFMTWHLNGDFDADGGTDLLILEAPEPWGPFSLVYFEEQWEGKAFTPYCPRLPLKWMANDHLSGWIQFSGTWSQSAEAQEKCYYRSNVRPFKLEM